MKIKIVIVVLVLAVAFAALKFMSSRKAPVTPAAPGPQVTQQEDQGVPLPAGATGQVPVSEVSTPGYIPPVAPVDYSGLTLLPGAMEAKGACEKGSPKEIIAAHGRMWGYFMGQNVGFNPDQSRRVYDYISEYYACASMSRGDVSLCDLLPGEAAQDSVKVEYGASPLARCRERAVPLLFRAYLAGKTNNVSVCQSELGDWYPANAAKVSQPDFCAAAAQGPSALAAYLTQKIPEFPSARGVYLPDSLSSCGGDQNCRNNFSVYKALKAGSADSCPENLKPFCNAFIDKTRAACAPIINEMSKDYCASLADANKRSKGFAGLTPDQVKEELKAQAAKKAEEDKRLKDNASTTKDINERVRAIMKKKGGE